MESITSAYKLLCIIIGFMAVVASCTTREIKPIPEKIIKWETLQDEGIHLNDVRVVTVDSVEYIVISNYKGGVSITPKLKK